MPIHIKSNLGHELVDQTTFSAEVHLQDTIAMSPGMLRQPGEPSFALVGRELSLRDAGYLDLLLVSAEGLPVAVEVKLALNGQSRREVVAQAVDYLSALTTYTNDELDAATGGSLALALRSFEPDTSEEDFERRWAAVGANLRAGLARVLIAVDSAPAGLERIVRFLAEASDLDIQLVAIERYHASNNGEIIVPRFLVSAASTERRPSPTANQLPDEELLGVVAAYNQLAKPDLQAVGAAKYYRQVRPLEWPARLRVHYEFYRTLGGIATELHLESDGVKSLASLLQPFAGTLLVPGAPPLAWDQSWNAGRGRLTARFVPGTDPLLVAQTMVRLIEQTRAVLTPRLLEIAASTSPAAQ